MPRRSFLICISLFCFGSSSAQKLSIIWGSEINTLPFSVLKTVYKSNNNELFLLHKRNKTLFRSECWQLNKLTANDLRLVQTREITNLFNDPKIKDIITVGFSNQLVASGNKTTSGKSEFVLKSLNDLNSLGSKTIDTTNSGDFKKRFLIANQTQDYLLHALFAQEDGNVIAKLKTIDSSLNIVQQRKFNLNIPQKDAEIVAVVYAETDLVYVLIGHSPRSEGIFRYDVFKYSLFACDLSSGLFKEFELSLPEKNITDIGIKPTLTGNLIVAGFYSNKTNTRDDVAGVFYLSINNQSLAINGRGIKELPEELLKQFMSERKLRKGKELSGFNINHLISNSDGGIIILAEQSYVNQVCNTDFRTGTVYCNDYYHFNDIIAIRINPTGGIDWTTRIGKRQVTVNDGGYFSSYFPFVVSQGIYLIYNDTPKNFGLTPVLPFAISSFRKPVALKVLLKNNGELTHADAVFSSKQNIILRPKSYFKLPNGEGIVVGVRGGNDVLGRIFEEKN